MHLRLPCLSERFAVPGWFFRLSAMRMGAGFSATAPSYVSVSSGRVSLTVAPGAPR
jgi:hypothetical protein